MNERLNPFLDLKEASAFTVKPKSERAPEERAIAQIAEDNNFPSRQARKQPKIEKRKPRIYRTGRNIQFAAKVTADTIAKIYKSADEQGVTLGKVLELAIDALERERTSEANST